MEILLQTVVEQIKDAAGSARFFIGAIAQRLEHPPVSRNVWGSNPHSLALFIHQMIKSWDKSSIVLEEGVNVIAIVNGFKIRLKFLTK